VDIKPETLYSFYPDLKPGKVCKFANCTHTTEPDCAVREAVERGKVSKGRYGRYIKIFDELKEQKKY